MTDLIVIPQADQWRRLKALVLDSVPSPITRRVYNLGLDEFFAWFTLTGVRSSGLIGPDRTAGACKASFTWKPSPHL